jgi:hypothetical protein
LYRKIIKFFRIPWPEKWLLAETLCLTGVVRLSIILLPFRWLSPMLGQHMMESPSEEEAGILDAARQVGWAVDTASRYTPWASKCLVQAIVGKVLLRQRGISNTLYLGVGQEEGEGLTAHAWLRSGNIILTGSHGRERFTVVGKFADYGKFEDR